LVFERDCKSEGAEICGSIAHEMIKITARVKKDDSVSIHG
jgi:hypothetical protein